MAPAGEMARLRAECRLLGIPITPKDSADRLRHKLRKLRERYAQACRPFVSDDEDLDSLDISDLDSESESESPELDEPSLAARAGAVAPAGESPLAPAAPARPTASLVRKVLPRQQARKEVDVHIIPPRAPSPPPDGCFGADEPFCTGPPMPPAAPAPMPPAAVPRPPKRRADPAPPGTSGAGTRY